MRWSVAIAVLMLGACELAAPGGETGTTPVLNAAGDKCNSGPYQEFIGQPPSVLDALIIVTPKRVIAFGSAVTQDYSETRINFDLDERGVISRVWCG